ncbi:glycoside hydrolase family 13 protein [Flagellimonas sp. HMM57]|uniref:glycoside hydrolase family 13 protein n=1 Tax=unclassified Flagellimonas TaxID=2644544 RepID=UPI0013D673BF|nr:MULTISPECIES: glycoside hydrolase family 13 protein [unclassified Flagellimonas]UII76740.1 glycoside hydrolase family 13 protein [Flagellimonas sp. HMM57]
MRFTPLLLLFLISFGLFSQVEKVEPPFWWSGMNNTSLQLMLYGKNIADYDVNVTKEITVTGIIKTENPNYVFVTIDTKDIPARTFDIEFSKKGKTVFKHVYELKSRREDSALRKGFDSSDVMYLIMPDRFANGNPSNDSHKEMQEKANRTLEGGRHGGDIQGIIDHLDYIKELGATAIWSTPLLEDDDEKYSYHTYAQSDYYRIDPRFGTNADYQRLGNELHKRDMKLIMDYVTNHWGAEHWMMDDLPTYDWIHQWPGYRNTSYRMTTQYDPNASAADAKLCMDGWFVESMPDLNQSNPLVLNYLTQNAIWWAEFANLDGFRVDTYSYNDKEGIAKWTKAIMEEYPNFNIVGEVWLHNQAQIAYWQKDSQIGALQSYNSNCPSMMDFTLHDALMEVFSEEESRWDKGVIKIYDNMVNDFLYPNIDNLLVFAENHDTPRINEIYPDIEDYKLIMTLIATIRGIPQIYYGSEIGMKGKKDFGDGDIRRDFPGGWEGDKNNAFTKDGRTDLQNDYFNFTKKVFNWRKDKSVIHTGKTMQFVPEDNVYVFFRYTESEKIMTIINNNPKSVTLDLSRFDEMLQEVDSGFEVISSQKVGLGKELVVEGKTSMIIEQIE